MFWSPYIYLYACYSHKSKSIKPNRMIFGGMIGYYPETIWLDFGIDRVKGQGHEKVKIFFETHEIILLKKYISIHEWILYIIRRQ